MCVEHPVELDAILPKRIHQRGALLIDQPPDVLDHQTSACGGGPEQAAPETGSLLVGPIHDGDRRGRASVFEHLERAKPGEHSKRTVEPAAIWNGVEVPSNDHRVGRGPGHHDPVVPRGVGPDLEAQFADLGGEPGARVTPHRSPRQPLCPFRRRRALGKLPQVGNDT